jgi:hypothetical protein
VGEGWLRATASLGPTATVAVGPDHRRSYWWRYGFFLARSRDAGTPAVASPARLRSFEDSALVARLVRELSSGLSWSAASATVRARDHRRLTEPSVGPGATSAARRRMRSLAELCPELRRRERGPVVLAYRPLADYARHLATRHGPLRLETPFRHAARLCSRRSSDPQRAGSATDGRPCWGELRGCRHSGYPSRSRSRPSCQRLPRSSWRWRLRAAMELVS